MRRITLILLAVAILFLYWMLQKVGWATIGNSIRQVGYHWPLLLVPYGITNFLGAISWRYILLTDEARPSLGRLYFLRLAGDSLNQLTPTASLGGEPYKVVRLKENGVPWQEATTSVVIQKGLMVLSLVLYIVLGLALVPIVLPGHASHLGILSLGALVLGVAGATFVIVQRRNPCVSGMRILERWGLCPALLKAKEPELASLDASLAGFYREHPGRGFFAFAFYFLSWAMHAVEVYLIFLLLGHPIGWGTALCLDSLAMLISGLGFMVPASLGVQDGGNILLSLGFSLGAALGAAFSILRRLREAFWLAVGLVVVAWEK